VRSILRNPVYTGRLVWNRLDFASARQNGGGVRLRAKEEWVVSEQAHAPLVSDETFERSQARFTERPRRQAGNGGRDYLFAGMVRCQTGHQPLSMQGKARKGHHYFACSYGSTYGDTAAADVHAGQKWIYLREDALLPLVERFFAERVFGPVRLDKLARQIKAHRKDERRAGRQLAARLRQQIADADRKLRLQVQALEDGVDAELVTARIAELRADRQAAEDVLAEIPAVELEAEADELAERLAKIPDLTEQLRKASRAVQRQVFEAFGLEIRFDKAERRIEVSATISEAVADAFENTETLRVEGLRIADGVTASDIAGAGFEPATFGL
jgi:site-specific DNA recombinase